MQRAPRTLDGALEFICCIGSLHLTESLIFSFKNCTESITNEALMAVCSISGSLQHQWFSAAFNISTEMAADYRPLGSPTREMRNTDGATSPSELDFMYDKCTIDQATIFIEDAITVWCDH